MNLLLECVGKRLHCYLYRCLNYRRGVREAGQSWARVTFATTTMERWRCSHRRATRCVAVASGGAGRPRHFPPRCAARCLSEARLGPPILRRTVVGRVGMWAFLKAHSCTPPWGLRRHSSRDSIAAWRIRDDLPRGLRRRASWRCPTTAMSLNSVATGSH